MLMLLIGLEPVEPFLQPEDSRECEWLGRRVFATIAGMLDENGNGASGVNALHRRGARALSRCLSLDLEVGRNDGRIHALAGARPDTDESSTYSGPGDRSARLDKLVGDSASRHGICPQAARVLLQMPVPAWLN